MGTQKTGASPADGRFESGCFQGCLLLQSTNTFTKQREDVMVAGKMPVCYVTAVSVSLSKQDA